MADEGKLTYLITKLINSFSLIFGGFFGGWLFYIIAKLKGDDPPLFKLMGTFKRITFFSATYEF